MNHPINPLSEAGSDELHHQLAGFYDAFTNLFNEPQRDQAPVMERAERILPSELFEELRAYLFSLNGHIQTVSELLYGDVVLLALDGLVVDPERCAVCDPESPDRCQVSDEVAQSRVVFVDDDASYTERWHPCVEHDCPKLVPFDDEPWCFTHSPDSGSSVRDYSWQRVNGISTIEHIERHHRLSAQFMRGLITSAEMQAALVVLVHDASAVTR